MVTARNQLIPAASFTTYHRCQCCGRVLERSRLRYCSRRCKDQFRFKLVWFNNLLRVLETRFASFSFTEAHLVLNVLPVPSPEVYTYIFNRLPGRKPAQDMSGMIFSLGEIWWGHMDETKSQKRASRKILSAGRTRVVGRESVTPVSDEQAAGVGQQLRRLKLSKADLVHPSEAEERLKTAFRRAALDYHPDTGGDDSTFRQVYAAYRELLAWLENPVYQTRRRGVPGQWCYIGFRRTWLAPL